VVRGFNAEAMAPVVLVCRAANIEALAALRRTNSCTRSMLACTEEKFSGEVMSFPGTTIQVGCTDARIARAPPDASRSPNQ
jgi:hypothetical protein